MNLLETIREVVNYLRNFTPPVLPNKELLNIVKRLQSGQDIVIEVKAHLNKLLNCVYIYVDNVLVKCIRLPVTIKRYVTVVYRVKLDRDNVEVMPTAVTYL